MTAQATPPNPHASISPPPRFVNLCITARCNLRCAMCHSGLLRVAEPQPERMLRFFDRLADWLPRPQSVYVTGGEPLLHGRLTEYVRRLAGHGFEVSLCTNGALLTVPRLDELIAAGLGIVNFPLDAPGELHDRLRSGPGLFQGVLDMVQYISEQTPLKLNVVSVIHALNCAELPGLARMLLANPRLNGVRFQAVVPTLGRPWSDEFFEQSPLWPREPAALEHVLRALDELEGLKRQGLPIHTPHSQFALWRRYFGNPRSLFEAQACRVGELSYLVLPDGAVSICDHCGVLGTIDDDPAALWSSPQAADLRRHMAECDRACIHRVNCFYLED